MSAETAMAACVRTAMSANGGYMTPCEVVHQNRAAESISHMLCLRMKDGWILDRIIDHMVLEPPNLPANYQPFIIYYFKRIHL